jgi:2'-5' RNA ligase
MNRLFVALKIPADIRKNIISLRDSALPDSKAYRWEPEEKIHLTLKFIGDVHSELTEPIANTLEFVTGYKSFKCKFTRFGFFSNKGQYRILWLGLTMDGEIDRLVEKLNKELVKFSIIEETRKFQPHLTIKRLRGDEGSNFIHSFESFIVPEIKFTANEISLMKSDLLPGGSKYTEIKKYNLK